TDAMTAAARPARAAAASASHGPGGPPAPVPADRRPHTIARLIPLERGFYAFRLRGEAGRSEAMVGLALPSVQVCAAPGDDARVEISDSFGRAGTWPGGR